MSKSLPVKARKFLEKAQATPTESEIYSIVVSKYKALDRPLQNRDIAKVHKSNRTNIRAHLANMVRKGIIKRHLHKFYLPVNP